MIVSGVGSIELVDGMRRPAHAFPCTGNALTFMRIVCSYTEMKLFKTSLRLHLIFLFMPFWDILFVEENISNCIGLQNVNIIILLCLIIIIKSDVWTIIHCLGLGHETMVFAVCLFIFLSLQQHSYSWRVKRTILVLKHWCPVIIGCK